MTMIKLLVSVMLSCVFAVVAGQGKGQFAGSVYDLAGKKPVAYATITVFTAADTSIVTYRLSDEAGKFSVPGLPLHVPLRAVITATGFEVWRKEFTLTPEVSQLDIGRQQMIIAIKEMDEVLVVAERPPVVVRRDTIEFNASAFKTLPTALVEDLLKKLPGVEVDREGNITVNGRRVNRMFVDGKEFFGSDPKIASKNLPANLIDKIQVTDDKEELQRNPDAGAGDIGQVINLKLKRSVKQGWFGKVYAGAGTNDRNELGGIVNMFRDTLQVSLLGYSNNLNRSGFSMQDVMNIGGFSRNNVNRVMVSSDGGFALNDISFGGLGTGIMRSAGGGINLNTLLGKKTTLSTQYFYGNTSSQVGQRSATQQFFNDTTLRIHNTNNSVTHDHSHRISAYLKTKLDTLNSFLEYRPSFTFTKSDRDGITRTLSGSNFDPQLNESVNNMWRNSKGFAMGHDITLMLGSRKKGRSFYAQLAFQLNTSDGDQYNDAENTFYKTGSATTLQQLRNQDQNSLNARFFASYNEPLAKNLSLRITQTLELFTNKDYINTWEYDPVTGDYTLIDPALTNGIKRNGLRSSSFAGINYKYKKLSITPGVTFRALHITNTFLKEADLVQRFFFVLPALTVNLSKWNFSYNISANEPAVSDLQPTVNNTNPLYVQYGNPNLKPALSHNISLNAYNFDMKRSVNYNVYSNISISENAVIRQRMVDENGVQTTSPVNANGVWRGYISANIRKQYKFSAQWKSSIGMGMYSQYNQGLVLLNANRSNTHNWSLGPSFNASINWDDKVELNQRYSPSWSKSTYASDVYQGLEFWRHTSVTDVVVRLPKRIVWESSLDYTYNPQVAAGLQKNIFRWNAAVNFLFLKQDKGQLKLSVFDILNQNNNISRTINENFIQDTETLVLRRYFLLTFSYNIRNFSAGKVGGRNSFMFF